MERERDKWNKSFPIVQVISESYTTPLKINRPDRKRLSKQKRNLGNSKIHAYAHINAHINTNMQR